MSGETASIEATVHRLAYSASFPCEGKASYDVGNFPHSLLDAFYPEMLIGRPLGDGTRVRVTVEIIEEKLIKNKCIVPWPSHRHRSNVVTVLA